ncbi:MAG: hypothetical protein KW806_03320, partial [Candidatus Yanofskybacteria bacterium]|nr:hypothetical protein [Candidatus Yanofskybacteria bacterium]
MEKVFLKPSPQEILTKGATPDGHTDIFSYEPDTDAARSMGSLFVIGHVQHSTDDLAYAINLIAALAKREYYSHTESTPKEAFSLALKKINEVVEEFFQKQDVALNIGVFSIANEHLLISKLGKFKILLSRDGKNIDVLNNIQFFSKEPKQETQFSSVISGRILPSDKIFAFYPSAAIARKEKTMKSDFLKLDRDQFIEKLKTAKTAKGAIACAALYIDLNEIREEAIAPKLEPKELQEEVTLAEAPKKTRKTVGDIPAIMESSAPMVEPEASTPHPKLTRIPMVDQQPAIPQEVPRIIPSEFALAKKSSQVSKIFQAMFTRFTPSKKAVMILAGVVVVVTASWGVNKLFLASPEETQAKAAVEEALNALKVARTKVSQNDISGARSLLANTLVTLDSRTQSTSSTEATDIRQQLVKALDDLDQAQEMTLDTVF